jgi:NAD(P)-dependent dehydrogenase (short-subunit alcohol dehydrogenase family)
MVWDIRDKRVIVTGGNTGIGKATAEELCRRGAEVVITARDRAKGLAAVASIGDRVPGALISWRLLDLGSRASVADFSAGFLAEFDRLDVLIHNAGLVLSDRIELEGGVEATFGINHLGPFLLNHELEPLLRTSAPSRIVVVASEAHRRVSALDFEDLQSTRRYSGLRAYSASKLANILFAAELARRLEGSGVTAYSLHPGVVATDFARDGDARGLVGLFFNWFRPFLLSPERGAQTSVHLACSPEIEGASGSYYRRCRVARPRRGAMNRDAARKLWEVSEAMLGLE